MCDDLLPGMIFLMFEQRLSDTWTFPHPIVTTLGNSSQLHVTDLLELLGSPLELASY